MSTFVYFQIGEHSYNNDEKLGQSYTFFLEKGGLSYTWQHWKRGLFEQRIRIMSYIGSFTPLDPKFMKWNLPFGELA